MEQTSMQPNIKILTVNISTEFTNKLLKNFSTNHYTITMIDNLFTESASKMIPNYQVIIVQTDETNYTSEKLKSFCQSNPNIEVIAITSETTQSRFAFQQAGLFDIISEDCSYEELTSMILRAEKHQKKNAELTILKQYVAMNYGFDNLVGESKLMTQLKEKIQKVAPTEISVMLTGQSGTGKSLTAQIIHHHSEKRKQPLVIFNPSSTPEIMMEETLFGNSATNTNGLLTQAANGTIVLKDIHTLNQNIQKRLYEFLQTNRTVRFISTSDVSLNKMVQQGTFDKEIYYKLSEVSIQMPTLNEHIDDIEMLAEYFIRKISFETERPLYTLSRSALELLYTHQWNENVRELESTIKRAVTLCRTSQIEESDILFVESTQNNLSTNRFTVDMTSDSTTGILDEGQRSLIVKTLNENDWNYSQTAVELGIGRTTLWRKVKKYNLKKETETVG